MATSLQLLPRELSIACLMYCGWRDTAALEAVSASVRALTAAAVVLQFEVHGLELGSGEAARPHRRAGESWACLARIAAEAKVSSDAKCCAAGGTYEGGRVCGYTLVIADGGVCVYGGLAGAGAVPRELADPLARVRAVAVGEAHALAATEGGALFTSGCGRHGKLGHGGAPTATQRPRRVLGALAGKRVSGVAAGANHSVASTVDGLVFTWGMGMFGQLGHGGGGGGGVLEAGEGAAAAGGEEAPSRPRDQLVPALVRGDLEGVVVAAVDAGDVFTLAVGACGALFSWGKGRHGQLGHGDERDCFVPTRVGAPVEAVRMRSIGAGNAHTVCVSDRGEVWTCGDGRNGRLGHGDEAQRSAFERVGALAGVRAIACVAGWAHSAVRTSTGGLYVFGRNEVGQLGLGERPGAPGEDELLPKRVLAVDRVVALAAGGVHTAVVCRSHVVSFGSSNLSVALRRAHAPSELETAPEAEAEAERLRHEA